jgi:antitoxin component YwqK of YwqJK toxin-antitoxin module
MKRVITALLVSALWVGANAQSKTDREQAGLLGAVRTVRTEAAEFTSKNGKSVEGVRVPLRTVSYDARGNRTRQVDFNHDGSVAQTLVYTYDANGRSTGYEEYTGAMSVPRKHVYVLDDKGNRIEYSFVQPDGSAGEKYLYKYDPKGNLAEESLFDHKGGLISRNVFAYDDKGRQVSQTRHNADGSVSSIISFSYDAQGKPVERVRYESDVLTYRVRYVYDRKMRVVVQETVGSVVEADVPPTEAHAPGRVVYVYKGAGQPGEMIAYAPDGALRERVVIKYDSRGNWIEKTLLVESEKRNRREARRVEHRTITYF